jgi:hypothetical protein
MFTLLAQHESKADEGPAMSATILIYEAFSSRELFFEPVGHFRPVWHLVRVRQP